MRKTAGRFVKGPSLEATCDPAMAILAFAGMSGRAILPARIGTFSGEFPAAR